MSYKDQILSLRAEGKSYSAIQNILGCSLGTISYYLGEGQRDKTNKRLRKSRSKLRDELRQFKEDNGCIDCNQKYPHYILDFDHLPEFEKLGNPIKISSRVSKTKGQEEINKCEVVCANCHKIRTWKRQHGEL